ncbi:hypothetical protein Tco_1125246 [Tanacetum coccineum]|uniref:Uncharacterized protein n=1 Tax=Tanacetum coccineum TaxID=301880 RepID=A0ABQ5J8H3_9ASTR
MIDELSIIETDKVILVVEIECFGTSFDEFDKETESSDGLQPMQADLSCVHALNEPHLHEIHVVSNKHEADQYVHVIEIMNPQETQQVAARDEKWVPSAERNSIASRLSPYLLDVPEIFMQQFCTPFKKVQGLDPYEFPLYPTRNFVDVPDADTALTFLIDLGYKGPLNKHTNMFMDHMHQPWRTLAAIINKCLSGKTASNDKLRKSRIDILWGMFNRENVDYPELIWEDLAYQIDHRKENRSRYDGIVSRLKFVRIGEDYQEYGLLISDVMLTDAIKRSESYQMFIKYSTNQTPPKKSRGKGSKGKKTAEERVVKKKVTLSADDNIISDDPDAALELAKSISQTKAEECWDLMTSRYS